MPTSIPYDPALVLGNLIEQDKYDNLETIAKLQGEIDSAQENLNSLIAMRRKLSMTEGELANMGIPTDDLEKELEQIDKDVAKAAAEYGQAYVKNASSITAAKSKQIAVHESIESPIDYNKTQIKKMPLSADSIKMDAQYFSFDQNTQSSKSIISQISSYVSAQTSVLGNTRSIEATAAAQTQATAQYENHNLEGTLVITATCTHKDALLLAPFILDVDKGIRVWNNLGLTPKIKTDDPSVLQKLAEEEGTDKEQFMRLISGATYGSSFVGMVHVLKSEDTTTSQTMVSTAGSLQAQMETGGWFASAQGGFGVDSSFAADVKNLLSSQSISSHVTLITMGAIPTIKSGEVQLGVKQFSEFDPAKMMDKLATLANATSSDQSSVAESAQAARTGQQMLSIRKSEVQSVMTGLGELDDKQNKMLDINSLMTAFEDYVNKALAGNIGVPINYYIKPISAAQLAQMWVAKYFPNKYLAIQGDDSDPNKDKQE